jgi:hypothetical protein
MYIQIYSPIYVYRDHLKKKSRFKRKKDHVYMKDY